MIWRRRPGARLTALAALVVVLAVPATSSAATLALIGGCPAMTAERPFLRWLDVGNYVLMPNGALEAGTTGWRLTGGAALAAGNETFYVHGTGDSSSLSLPSGSSATTSTLCTTATSPTLRFVARNSGSLLSTLKVEVLYTDLLGQPRALTVGLLLNGSSWQPTLPVLFLANLLSPPLLTNGTTNVAFRFTPQGSLSGWKLDDVYVDPFKSE
jgi:hypothetical protein